LLALSPQPPIRVILLAASPSIAFCLSRRHCGPTPRLSGLGRSEKASNRLLLAILSCADLVAGTCAPCLVLHLRSPHVSLLLPLSMSSPRLRSSSGHPRRRRSLPPPAATERYPPPGNLVLRPCHTVLPPALARWGPVHLGTASALSCFLCRWNPGVEPGRQSTTWINQVAPGNVFDPRFSLASGLHSMWRFYSSRGFLRTNLTTRSSSTAGPPSRIDVRALSELPFEFLALVQTAPQIRTRNAYQPGLLCGLPVECKGLPGPRT